MLVIDDDASICAVIERLGEKAGFAPERAVSIEDAKRAVHDHRFDCITLDLSIGADTGVELLSTLAEMASRTPIIIISGSMRSMRDFAVSIGNNLHLAVQEPFSKPIDFAKLKEALIGVRQKLAGQAAVPVAEGHEGCVSELGVPVAASPQIAPDGSEVEFDASAFENLAAELGREDTLDTFAIFFNEASNRLKRLRQLSCEQERTTLAQEAHGLKGSAANFGLRQVSDLAAGLERNARTITAEDYAAALQRLETSYAAACDLFAKLSA